MGNTWIVDMSHYDWRDEDEKEMPRPAVRLAEYFASIVEATVRIASLDIDGGAIDVQCRRRPGRRRCAGRIHAELYQEDNELYWQCPVCGDNGRISNWAGTRWDPGPRAPFFPQPKLRLVTNTVDQEVETIQGTIEWDQNSPNILPRIVSETAAYSWDELGRKLMTYDGFRITITVN